MGYTKFKGRGEVILKKVIASSLAVLALFFSFNIETFAATRCGSNESCREKHIINLNSSNPTSGPWVTGGDVWVPTGGSLGVYIRNQGETNVTFKIYQVTNDSSAPLKEKMTLSVYPGKTFNQIYKYWTLNQRNPIQAGNYRIQASCQYAVFCKAEVIISSRNP